jgi:hypothetical protein
MRFGDTRVDATAREAFGIGRLKAPVALPRLQHGFCSQHQVEGFRWKVGRMHDNGLHHRLGPRHTLVPPLSAVGGRQVRDP